jgi:uncharacterized pyridoxamine 5'-phosphate oxidase family protein
MTREEILTFVQANPTCFMATVEEGQPRVRGMRPYRIEDGAFYFITGRGKDVFAQIAATPRLELCFWSEDQGRMVRISGEVEILDDIEHKHDALEAFPFLRPAFEAMGPEAFAVVRLAGGLATWWTMAENMAPKQFIQI